MPQVKCKSFDDLIDCLETDYTLTVRDICEKLKITRPTFEAAIKPHISYIKVGGFVRIDEHHYERNRWNAILNKMEIIKGSDLTYYNKPEFDEFIYTHTNFSQQTKIVEMTDYVEKETELSNYYLHTEQAKKLVDRYNACPVISERKLLAMERQGELNAAEKALYKSLTMDGKMIMDTAPNPTKRTLSPAVEVKMPKQEFLKAEWLRVSEIAGWGGTTEQAMRFIFLDSKIRCEIVLPNNKGAETKIVRYMDDPYSIGYDHSSESIRRLAACKTLEQYQIKVREKRN